VAYLFLVRPEGWAMTTNHKKSKDAASDPDAVERYLKALAHPLKAEIEAVRRIILKADARVTEGIKWNVPSFHAGEWFATFDFRSKEWIQIVFHRGAKVKFVGDSRYVKDARGILKWIANDRCTVKFVSKKDVESKAAALAAVVAEWVENLSNEEK